MIVSSGSASKATSDAPPLGEWQILGIWALTPKRECILRERFGSG